jgi:hypothetical protein
MVKTVTAFLLLLMAFTVPSLAQGICVIDEMRVQTIKGCVTDPNGLPISEATVELFKKGADGVIAKVATDENGCFSIPDAAPGRYEIAARYPSLRSLYVPVRVTRESKAQKKQQEIVIVLNGLMDKPCGGGTAHLRAKVHPKRKR